MQQQAAEVERKRLKGDAVLWRDPATTQVAMAIRFSLSGACALSFWVTSG